jgi:Predicted Zn-dependent protease
MRTRGTACHLLSFPDLAFQTGAGSQLCFQMDAMGLLGGIILLHSFPQLLLAGIVLFALTTLFSFITLPVEINASRRAIAWLSDAGITNYETDPMAKDALRSAAYTYVVAALSSLATLVYYILIFLSGSDRD